MSRWSWLLGAWLPWVLAAPACSSSGKGECVSGHADCPCTPDSRCLQGLTCDSRNLCVDSDSSGGADNDDIETGGKGSTGGKENTGGTDGSSQDAGAGGSDTGVDPSACVSCWQSACATEYSACQTTSLCSSALTCLTDCVEDGQTEDCAVCSAEGDPDAEAAFFAFSLCADAECSAPCGVEGGQSCTEADLPTGSCYAKDGEICIGSEWQPEDCTGCGLLQPPDICKHIRAFVLDPLKQWSVVRGGLGSLIHTTDSVTATFNFSAAGQVGILQYLFAFPTASNYGITVLATPTAGVKISLENEAGTSGCQYSLDSAGSAYQSAADGCWHDGGTFYSIIPGVYGGSAASHVNVRLTASGPGIETLTVEAVRLQF
jgi:hypothetical protein